MMSPCQVMVGDLRRMEENLKELQKVCKCVYVCVWWGIIHREEEEPLQLKAGGGKRTKEQKSRVQLKICGAKQLKMQLDLSQNET